jgi:cytochrome P450
MVDLVRDFALPLPIAVLVRLMGIPEEDAPMVQRWATSFNLAIGGVIHPDRVSDAERAIGELSAYLRGIFAAPHRQSTVLGSLHNAVAARELDDAELVASCLMLVTAGHETTTNLIGNAILALCRHPTQQTWLRTDLDRVPSALDELVRYDAPVQLTAREAVEPLVIGSVRIPRGSRVIPLWGAANRDPDRFADPGALDLCRAGSQRQLGFGLGSHRCLGASIARMEAAVAIRAVLERFVVIAPAEPPVWKQNFSFRGLDRFAATVERV